MLDSAVPQRYRESQAGKWGRGGAPARVKEGLTALTGEFEG